MTTREPGDVQENYMMSPYGYDGPSAEDLEQSGTLGKMKPYLHGAVGALGLMAAYKALPNGWLSKLDTGVQRFKKGFSSKNEAEEGSEDALLDNVEITPAGQKALDILEQLSLPQIPGAFPQAASFPGQVVYPYHVQTLREPPISRIKRAAKTAAVLGGVGLGAAMLAGSGAMGDKAKALVSPDPLQASEKQASKLLRKHALSARQKANLESELADVTTKPDRKQEIQSRLARHAAVSDAVTAVNTHHHRLEKIATALKDTKADLTATLSQVNKPFDPTAGTEAAALLAKKKMRVDRQGQVFKKRFFGGERKISADALDTMFKGPEAETVKQLVTRKGHIEDLLTQVRPTFKGAEDSLLAQIQGSDDARLKAKGSTRDDLVQAIQRFTMGESVMRQFGRSLLHEQMPFDPNQPPPPDDQMASSMVDPSQMQLDMPDPEMPPPPQQGQGVTPNPLVPSARHFQKPMPQGHGQFGAVNLDTPQAPAPAPSLPDEANVDMDVPASTGELPSFKLSYAQSMIGAALNHPNTQGAAFPASPNPPAPGQAPMLEPNPVGDMAAQGMAPPGGQEALPPDGMEGDDASMPPQQGVLDAMPPWMRRRFRAPAALPPMMPEGVVVLDPYAALLEGLDLEASVDGYLESIRLMEDDEDGENDEADEESDEGEEDDEEDEDDEDDEEEEGEDEEEVNPNFSSASSTPMLDLRPQVPGAIISSDGRHFEASGTDVKVSPLTLMLAKSHPAMPDVSPSIQQEDAQVHPFFQRLDEYGYGYPPGYGYPQRPGIVRRALGFAGKAAGIGALALGAGYAMSPGLRGEVNAKARGAVDRVVGDGSGAKAAEYASKAGTAIGNIGKALTGAAKSAYNSPSSSTASGNQGGSSVSSSDDIAALRADAQTKHEAERKAWEQKKTDLEAKVAKDKTPEAQAELTKHTSNEPSNKFDADKWDKEHIDKLHGERWRSLSPEARTSFEKAASEGKLGAGVDLDRIGHAEKYRLQQKWAQDQQAAQRVHHADVYNSDANKSVRDEWSALHGHKYSKPDQEHERNAAFAQHLDKLSTEKAQQAADAAKREAERKSMEGTLGQSSYQTASDAAARANDFSRRAATDRMRAAQASATMSPVTSLAHRGFARFNEFRAKQASRYADTNMELARRYQHIRTPEPTTSLQVLPSRPKAKPPQSNQPQQRGFFQRLRNRFMVSDVDLPNLPSLYERGPYADVVDQIVEVYRRQSSSRTGSEGVAARSPFRAPASSLRSIGGRGSR